MPEPIHAPDNGTHSFVIRIWEEMPGQWRGTIRHVQSQAQQGFTMMSQALQFVEQRVSAISPEAERKQPKRAAPPTFRFDWLPRRLLQPAWAAVGVLAVLVVVLALMNPNMSVPLSGAAAGTGIAPEIVLAFLAGVMLGALSAGLWFHRSSNR